MKTVIARDSTTVVGHDDIPVVVVKGDVWDAEDPLVRRFPWLFGDAPQDVIRSTEPVERNTANPGERRPYVRRG